MPSRKRKQERSLQTRHQQRLIALSHIAAYDHDLEQSELACEAFIDTDEVSLSYYIQDGHAIVRLRRCCGDYEAKVFRFSMSEIVQERRCLNFLNSLFQTS